MFAITPAAAPGREIQLDFLRGIAILMVVDFHSKSQPLFLPFRLLGYTHFGWVGVDIFFVLSGFLVGGLLMAEWKRTRGIDFKRFLIRRSFKILPQYYVYLFAIVLTGHRSFFSLRSNFFHLQNYGDGIPHTWSLAVEEHTYLFLVLVFAAGVAFRVGVRPLFFSMAALVVFVHVLRFVLALHGVPIYYYTHTRIDGILSGVLLAMVAEFAPRQFAWMRRQTWVWLALLMATLTYYRFGFTGRWADAVAFDVANVLAIALLMLLYKRKPLPQLTGIYAAVAWVGLYSYGIYLWHVATIGPIAHLGLHLSGLSAGAWNTIMPFVAAIAIGAVTTRLIEFPMLRLRERWFPKRTGAQGMVRQPVAVQAADAELNLPGLQGNLFVGK